MRHNRSGRKLGRKTGHRLAMFRNQLVSLVSHGRIVTTLPKAKELRPLIERVVTQGKRGTVHARRMVGRWIASRDLIKKVFDDIAPRFATRPGGYTRIVKLGSRVGDGAEMAVLEFVDFELKKKATAAKPEEAREKDRKRKGRASAGEESAAPAPEAKSEKPKRGGQAGADGKPEAAKKTRAKADKAPAKVDAKPKRAPAATRKASAPKKVGGS